MTDAGALPKLFKYSKKIEYEVIMGIMDVKRINNKIISFIVRYFYYFEILVILLK